MNHPFFTQAYLFLLLNGVFFSVWALFPSPWPLWQTVTFACFSLTLATYSTFSYQSFSSLISFYGTSPRKLFYKFGEKISMTACLLLFFTVLFLLIAFFFYNFTSQESFQQHLAFGLEHPGLCIIWGFFICALNALLILFIRMLIKYFYIMRKL